MNYFKELNPMWKDEKFDLDNAVAVDGNSKELNMNMKSFIENQFKNNSIIIKKCEVEYLYESYGVNLNGRRLTCDYLGPSTYYALQAFSKSFVLDYVIRTREFGGHMIWPSLHVGIGRLDKYGNEIMKSINTARSYCLRERFDYTLFEIMAWYTNQSEKGTEIFQRVLDANGHWFHMFGKGEKGYRSFIDIFAFNDSVDINTYEPYDYSSFDGEKYQKTIQKRIWKIDGYIPRDKEIYIKYIEGTVNALIKRDNRIKSNLEYQNF